MGNTSWTLEVDVDAQSDCPTGQQRVKKTLYDNKTKTTHSLKPRKMSTYGMGSCKNEKRTPSFSYKFRMDWARGSGNKTRIECQDMRFGGALSEGINIRHPDIRKPASEGGMQPENFLPGKNSRAVCKWVYSTCCTTNNDGQAREHMPYEEAVAPLVLHYWRRMPVTRVTAFELPPGVGLGGRRPLQPHLHTRWNSAYL
ncbi:uncharacterized protein CLUP02_10405 [Colletotrichum lupini]|uniref:Uncharacterized protein n=1 Tax=Colletotrichum lupini TaxID=145971 RepID=A0A9Q8WIR3_9PEZI|nr:uncharacterized protein CLUP02_10405 [Colletotrichum lupini]UQC84909.1 hypothetical protein CLUP02_10405 [Colletotrichum lupini]